MSEPILSELEALQLEDAMKRRHFASVEDGLAFIQGWMDAAAARRKDRDQWMAQKIASVGGKA